MIKSKKSKVPLEEVMKSEKKGGWGRHIKGVERTVDALAKQDENYDMILDLQEYVEDIHLARKLQADHITLLTDEKFHAILKRLKNAKCKFGNTMQKRFLERNLVCFIKKLIAEPDGMLTEEMLAPKFDLMSMWPSSVGVAPAFDIFDTKLIAIASEPVRHGTFVKYVIKQLVVPMVLKSDIHGKNLVMLLTSLKARVCLVDDLHLDLADASSRSDFIDVANALVGVLGDLTTQCKYIDQITMMADANAKGGPEMLDIVARALRAGPAKHQLELISNNASVLITVSPAIDRHTAALDEASSAVLQVNVAAAAKFLTEYRDHVPQESWLDELRSKVEATATKCFGSSLADVRSKVAASKGDANQDAKFAINQLQLFVNELSLAFPMDAFHLEWAELLADAIRAYDAKSFEGRFLSSLGEFSANFEDNVEPTPASPEKAAAFKACLALCRQDRHFTGDAYKERLGKLITECVGCLAGRLDARWAETADVINELAKFLDHSLKHATKLQVQVCGFDDLLEKLRIAIEMGDGPTREAWQPALAAATSKGLSLQSSLAPRQAPAPEGSLCDETSKKIINDKFDVLSQLLMGLGTKCQDNLRAEIHLHTKDVSEGCIDPAVKWLGEKQLSDWTDFEEVVAAFETSVKPVKLKDVAGFVKRSRVLLAACKSLAETTGCVLDFGEEIELTTRTCALTKMISCIMRHIVVKGGTDASLRPFVRAEILEASTAFSPTIEGFKWDTYLPAALVSRVRAIISPKRKLASS